MATVYSASQDLVAILDNDSLQPLFTAARPMRVAVDRSKTVTQYPVENGTTRNDHVVDLPVELNIDLTITEDTRAQYETLAQAFASNTLVVVQTKVTSFRNMLIYALPHDETVPAGESITLPIRLVEWREVQPSYGTLPPSKVANKAQSSTVTRGTQQTNESTKKQSILYEIFH